MVDTSLYKQEMEQELDSILAYWMQYAVDQERGGFFGKVNNDNVPDPAADKGVVLNARILWAFTAAYNLTGTPDYLTIADRAFAYITEHFIDAEFGGAYWTVDAAGNKASGDKRVMGQAACLHAMAEYYKATGLHAALEQAARLFNLVEQHAFDRERLGYTATFNEDWSAMNDGSSKVTEDQLHILEAYTSLYQVLPEPMVKERIEDLLDVFDRHIIDHESGHLETSFDASWQSQASLVVYGYDMNAAWLLEQAATVISEEKWINKAKEWAISLADAAGEGLDDDDGLSYGYHPEQDRQENEKQYWPQAEAMIGFLNAWQVSGRDKYLKASYASWEFTRKHIRDSQQGEWWFGVNEDYSPIAGKDKVDAWKSPYNNTRACIEIIRRLN
ncbi:AGE family epimerase/isomerase [Chitinophaga horti]|uniref:Cellobiose 2-epimerase n=1 Tax=Chitinophaga horti TaxID=2920382 RepID=A0ABY6J205_9BACT|nr:AGE family epimerase/isomerase [Chitinophaga horti]UYQ92381.1 AGE family epimerase/isomerase [Chitinophaga horti]